MFIALGVKLVLSVRRAILSRMAHVPNLLHLVLKTVLLVIVVFVQNVLMGISCIMGGVCVGSRIVCCVREMLFVLYVRSLTSGP